MISIGADHRSYQMTMHKGDPRYDVSARRVLFAEKGTELRVSPLLEGIRTLSGERSNGIWRQNCGIGSRMRMYV